MNRPQERQPRSKRQEIEKELRALHSRFADLARELFMSRPHARDVVRPLPPFEAQFKVGFTGRGEEREEEIAALMGRLESHLDDSILAQAAYAPGTVYSFFRREACPLQGRPSSPREVFVEYSETGVPRFQSLLDLAIERADPGVEQLTKERGSLVILASERKQLIQKRLSSFADGDQAYDLRGQLALGYFLGGPEGAREKYAVTLQIVRTSTRSKSVRLSINTIGLLPGGQPAETLFMDDPEHQVCRLVRAADRELGRINTELKKLDAKKRMKWADTAARELLRDMQSGLGRERRRAGWRTEHARERAGAGQRPTGMARGDLERARKDRVFHDQKDDTYVVLGAKGRTHVFNKAGLHVTSLQLDAKAIESRTGQKRWLGLDGAETDKIVAQARLAFERAAT